METYVIKSALLLALFFLFYKTLLENTSAHLFKRFYLLMGLVLSFSIPLITFTTYVEVAPIASTAQEVIFQKTSLQPQAETIDYFPLLMYIFYGLGVCFFGIRLCKNLFNIGKKIAQNPIEKQAHIYHVLLQKETVPHTFFRYIFLNKKQYEQREIPKEVLLHEQTHARQKHTLDILLIEVLQVIFWFNPLFYFFKRSMKLNHEFLADQAVLNQGASAYDYQNMLLAFSSNAPVPQLAHSFNYSSSLNALFSKSSFGLIKKRLTVMKTQTSKKGLLLRTLLLLPMVALALYGFSEKKTETRFISSPTVENPELKDTSGDPLALVMRMAKHDAIFYFEGKQIDKDQAIAYVKADSNLNVLARPYVTPPVVKISKHPLQEAADDDEIATYNSLATKYNAQPVANRTIPSQDLARLEYLYSAMNAEQRTQAEPFPECKKPDPLSITVQGTNINVNGKSSSLRTFAKDIDKATKGMNADTLRALKLNIRINSTSDAFLKELEAEFQKTALSKANYGISLVPPPPPKAPEPPKAPARNHTVSSPPVPPTPPNPLPARDPAEKLLELKERGASFYWGPHPMSPEEAVKMVRENPRIHIEIDETNALHPIVKLNGC